MNIDKAVNTIRKHQNGEPRSNTGNTSVGAKRKWEAEQSESEIEAIDRKIKEVAESDDTSSGNRRLLESLKARKQQLIQQR